MVNDLVGRQEFSNGIMDGAEQCALPSGGIEVIKTEDVCLEDPIAGGGNADPTGRRLPTSRAGAAEAAALLSRKQVRRFAGGFEESRQGRPKIAHGFNRGSEMKKG